MSKGFWLPLAIILGILLAFAWVFRDQANPLSKWVSGGRTTGIGDKPLPDSGNVQG